MSYVGLGGYRGEQYLIIDRKTTNGPNNQSRMYMLVPRPFPCEFKNFGRLEILEVVQLLHFTA